ncbi:hypothetical protein Tdes44962_MAKER05765 [Teratosphaeria destructans]|uniref:Uncharacterized protein n=1 Tax=Teratosphaeria destructans TaxID=418781 RepID=A0A9W7VY89_9PEZI|nr:hypothetical protein Tdes44962_MAKER05765 [Teratosphaeria destructans]
MALLARISSGEKDSDGDELPPGLHHVTCDGEFYTYGQCVFFEDDDDPRGTYDKGVTVKACNAYPHHPDYPPFEFVEADKACEDVQGLSDNVHRRLCNTDLAKLCFELGGGYIGKGGYGSNMGETLEEMYSYADEGGNVTSVPPKEGKKGKKGKKNGD